MANYVLRRFAIAIPLLLFVSMVVFLMMQLTPGDPAVLMLGQDATPEGIRQLRQQFGLDLPLPAQYVVFVANLFHGDLGRSYQTHLPVAGQLALAWPATVQLAVISMAIALAIGIPAGILTAARRASVVDHATRILLLLAVSMPVFWLGPLLIYLFALQLAWLPTSGSGTPQHLVLPAISLATFTLAVIVRLTRSSMIDVLQQDYIRTARAKGLHQAPVLVGHALRNSLIPVVTIAGLQFGQLLAGAALTETVFNWPGLGRLVVTAVFNRDYPMIRGTILLIAATFIIVNLLVDMVYAVLDPRIRYS